MIKQTTLQVSTMGRGFTDLTTDVKMELQKCEIHSGLANIFIHHTSASLFINENADPDVQIDLENWMSRVVLDGDPNFRHIAEGKDDMSAHIRSVLTATSLNIPILNGQLAMGTWQGIYLWEHRTKPHQRRITVTLMGD